MTPFVVVALIVVAAAAVGGYLFLKRPQGDSKAFHHFRCPACRRRLRFQERQVGHQGRCSNCGKPVIFPPVSQSID